MSRSNLNKSRQMLVDSFIKCLEEETLPWSKGWTSLSMGEMQNPVSKTKYKGGNVLLLSIIAAQRGYEDPRWCTFHQAADRGWHIKKGTKGVPVEFWSVYDTVAKKAISFQDYHKELTVNERPDDEFKIMSRTYVVFNGSCIDGIPAYDKPESQKLNTVEMNAFIQNAITNMKVGYREFGNSAYYTPSIDTITMPPRHQFENQYEFNSTLLHELSHSTAAPSRLNREIKNPFGSERYAEEELRAEISSVFLSQYLDIDISESRLNNHKAYVQSWASALKKDPNVLFRAIKDAESISDYIIEKGEYEILRSSEVVVDEKPSLENMIRLAEQRRDADEHHAACGVKDFALEMQEI